MRYFSAFFFSLSVLIVLPAAADNFELAHQAMCEKMKVCAVETMKRENGDSPINGAIRVMLAQQLDQACVAMKADFNEARSVAGGLEKAAACMNSLSAKTCVALNNMEDDPNTKECTEFQQLSVQ
ncbi:hypothetical protein [Pseudovibrio sp. Tun.PSC04-5.I4]|uniref:hypothetical protein n=1 Tax=Pseudovibrio sp. Tun.PSC04-5.I4 TaxID=1798213 RepID=UPI00088B44A2|nr:hypothetical protein [Pseudovibrio sp. Tun.PSC04-5.I4]SDQ78527.1 hypothetical protein SAMN04515695_1387 [Pseudovibrio sp. Tun.PSC04-5.I4]